MSTLSPLLLAALDEVRPLVTSRGWQLPSDAVIAEAERVLALVASTAVPPAVQCQPEGAVTFDWDAGDQGWLSVSVRGEGQLEHSAVINEDEYSQCEPFDGRMLPPWAGTLLQRLSEHLPKPH